MDEAQQLKLKIDILTHQCQELQTRLHDLQREYLKLKQQVGFSLGANSSGPVNET